MRKRKYDCKTDNDTQTQYFMAPYTRITKSPGDNSLNPAEGQVQIVDIKLSEDRYLFNTKEDSYSALRIFIKCVDKGYYPPSEILKFFRGKFEKYLHSDKSLDSVIGLSKTGKKASRIMRRNIKITTEVDTLIHYFKINMSDAIYAVSRRYEDKAIELSDSTVLDIYNRCGKADLENSLMIIHKDIKWLDAMSKELRNEKLKKLIKKYPDDVKDYLIKKYSISFL